MNLMAYGLTAADDCNGYFAPKLPKSTISLLKISHTSSDSTLKLEWKDIVWGTLTAIHKEPPPIYLDEFEYENFKLRFRKTKVLQPKYDGTSDLLCVREQSLGIDVCGLSLEELREAVAEDLDVLWRNYAQEPENKLTPAAQKLKRALLDAIEEVEGAPE